MEPRVPLNAALEGRAYPAVAFTIDAARARAFAAAVGHPGSGVPPTFATAPEIAAGLDNAIADPELGLDLSRVLHTEQEYTWHRALREDEALSARATIESIRAKGGLEILVLATELRDAGGELVVSGRTTLIVRDPG